MVSPFFYARDFTFICTTELAALGEYEPEFKVEDAVVIGVSTDSFYTHKAWFEADPHLAGINFPIIADTSHTVSEAYEVLLNDGTALRGTFIIDPVGAVRNISINELDVGRNISEVLRILRALKTGEPCPVGWQPGQSTLTSYNEWLAKALPRLSREGLIDASAKLQTIKYNAGDVVFEEGDVPDKFYVIVSGEAEVVRSNSEGEEFTLTSIQAGDYFGEIGLLIEARRTATIRATTDLKLLAMDWESFRSIVEASDSQSNAFAEVVHQRVLSL